MQTVAPSPHQDREIIQYLELLSTKRVHFSPLHIAVNYTIILTLHQPVSVRKTCMHGHTINYSYLQDLDASTKLYWNIQQHSSIPEVSGVQTHRAKANTLTKPYNFISPLSGLYCLSRQARQLLVSLPSIQFVCSTHRANSPCFSPVEN